MSYARLLNSRALGAVLALACVGIANANSLTYSFDIADQRAGWNTATNSPSLTPSLSRFNPTLGTLTSVSYSLTGTVSGTLKMANVSTSSSSKMGGFLKAQIGITLPGQPNFSVNLLPTTATVTQTFSASTNGIPNYTAPYGGAYNLSSSADASGTYTSTANPSELAFFIGTNDFSFNIATLGKSAKAEGDGNANFAFTTLAGAKGTVTYNFTPAVQATPEPCTMGLLAVGAMGAARRRFRRSRSN